jgi:hypothetical protein
MLIPMTSTAKIKANRRNALMSTGPRSEEGRGKARFNAVRHGLTAETAILPHESSKDYDALLEGLRAELMPVGVLEELLVVRIASRILRLARVVRIETGILLWELHGDEAESDSAGPGNRSVYRLLLELGAENRNAKAEKQLSDEAEAARSSDLARLGRAFIRDSLHADSLSKLSRYEARLDRALLRDITELAHLREHRAEEKSIAARPVPGVDLPPTPPAISLRR